MNEDRFYYKGKRQSRPDTSKRNLQRTASHGAQFTQEDDSHWGSRHQQNPAQRSKSVSVQQRQHRLPYCDDIPRHNDGIPIPPQMTSGLVLQEGTDRFTMSLRQMHLDSITINTFKQDRDIGILDEVVSSIREESYLLNDALNRAPRIVSGSLRSLSKIEDSESAYRQADSKRGELEDLTSYSTFLEKDIIEQISTVLPSNV